ncbi:MAG: TonB C-terminal domain-containing protein [Methylophilaceae bacterium]
MIRKHENSVSWKAGALAVAVHVVLLSALLISFNWKAAHNVLNVTEVDLWDKLPAQNAPKPEPKPETKPDPVVKEEPKPDPKVEEKQKIEEQQKLEEKEAEIALEKKKQELAEKERQMAEKEKQLEEKKLEEKRKKDEDRKKLLAAMRDEDLNKEEKKDKSDALKKFQQEALNEEKGDSDKKSSAANASLIGEFTAKIRLKIRSHVNKTVCGDGNPELRFEIGLLPTGELAGKPIINKSSGITACDDAVERAIIESQPLPLPPDQSLFQNFRNLNLKFRPNDN